MFIFYIFSFITTPSNMSTHHIEQKLEEMIFCGKMIIEGKDETTEKE